MNSSKRLIIQGVTWNGIQLVISQSFTFIIRLVLARLLFPDDFGLIGMALVFTGFVTVLNDLGMGAAIVQRKEEDLSDLHLYTAFWIGIAWSLLLFIIMCFVIGPVAASFYNEPILTSLIPVLSIGILSSPINLIHKAQLTKAMNFKKIAFVESIASVSAGCLALCLAFFGAGVWSLAFNSVVSLLIAVPLYFQATGWQPKFIWDKECFVDIFGFGVYTTGTNIINFVINNIDFLLIGKFLNAQSLGAYTFAFILTDTFRGRLMAVINNVMYPFYGKKQDDPISLKRYYLKVVEYNSIVVYPIMVLLFLLADPIIVNFFGEKWLDSIIPLKLLAVAVMIHLMVNSNTALIRGMGRPDLEMKLQIFKSFIFIPMLVLGIQYDGIIGAAWAVLINKIIAVLIAQYTFNRLLKLPVSTVEFINALKVPVSASVIAYGIGYVLFHSLNLHFLLVVFIFIINYGVIVWLLMRDELKKQIGSYKANRSSNE